LKLAEGTRTQRQWTQLMDASEALLLATSRSPANDISLAAERLLQDPTEWRRWELEFGRAMRKVVIPVRRNEQINLLRMAGFSWIHSAEPFRHVRDSALRGADRQRVVSGLHNGYGFARAMVAEHKSFVRSNCSYACSAHIGESILGDEIFIASMRRYRQLYSEYFNAYCAASFPDRTTGEGERSLLPLLKLQVAQLRRAILEYPRDADWLQLELQHRVATGETQRLPRVQ
jgi:hypothetical protein